MDSTIILQILTSFDFHFYFINQTKLYSLNSNHNLVNSLKSSENLITYIKFIKIYIINININIISNSPQ